LHERTSGSLRPENVHIILFKPNTEEQGIHTIEYPKGSGNNIILAFESKVACDEFAATLKAQQFFDPMPQIFNLDSLEMFCEQLGVLIQVVPKEMVILPPTQNVNTLGHNPNLNDERNKLDYLFEVSGSDSVGDIYTDHQDGLHISDNMFSVMGSWE